jgi:hypothetical protein
MQYPNGRTDANNQKKEKESTKKTRYGIPALLTTIHPPPRQT